jgi:hypothetical protein
MNAQIAFSKCRSSAPAPGSFTISLQLRNMAGTVLAGFAPIAMDVVINSTHLERSSENFPFCSFLTDRLKASRPDPGVENQTGMRNQQTYILEEISRGTNSTLDQVGLEARGTQ